ncbi:MAG: hypothetical protein JKY65_03275 [Planctomycetes bacterium]|nr:hypothetical protein [Planctomycetota bacterium]
MIDFPRKNLPSPETQGDSAGVRIRVWREALVHGAVRLYRKEEQRVPALQLLHERLGPVSARQPREAGRRATRPRKVGALGSAARFRLCSPDATPLEADFLAAPSAADLAAFLVDADLETSDDRLRHLLRVAREEGEDKCEMALNLRLAPRYPGSPEEEAPPHFNRIFALQENFDLHYPAEVQLGTSRLRGSKLSSCLLSAPTLQQHRGISVPRRLSVLVSDGDDCLIWDGSTLRERTVHQIPEELFQAFDRSGECVGNLSGEALFEGHLSARALVRVPPVGELQELLSSHHRLRRPRHKVLATPAIVRPSTALVPLSGREPVIEEPRLVAWVLRHLVGGIYLPEDGTPRARAAEAAQEGVLILCDLGPAS